MAMGQSYNQGAFQQKKPADFASENMWRWWDFKNPIAAGQQGVKRMEINPMANGQQGVRGPKVNPMQFPKNPFNAQGPGL